MNVKLNDTVAVIAGEGKGKQGKVIAVSPKNNTVKVQGVRMQHKHKKAKKATEVGGIVEMEAPIDASNVMVVCPKCGKPTRVGVAVVDGKRVRVCKQDGCGAELVGKVAKKAKKSADEPKKTRKRTSKADAETEVKDEVVEKKAKAKKTTEAKPAKAKKEKAE